MALWSNTDAEASKPKYLNAADKAATEGISVAEAQTKANKDKGVQHPGWVKTTTYTDAQGNTRNKTETLVAMSSITGDDNTDDTTIGIDPVITITTQPVDVTVDLSDSTTDTATFSVVASATGSGAVTYQWQKQESGAGAWSNVTNATSASYTTGVLTVADDNTDKYRVVVSTVGGADATSTAATLTVQE
jgi:hypothetical protein